jgi:alkanesulfonate monooxygenase SsuD/methylene tetrahydromethanopterin reductase-like flavin-dependent oxidoreductase (luciferase family)
VRLGLHLPTLELEPGDLSLRRLLDAVTAAEAAGLDSIFSGDRLTYPLPRLDGVTSLAAVLPAAQRSELVAFCAPGLRGVVPTGRALAALDVLSEGRLVVAAGAGSGAADYDAVGLDWADRDTLLADAVPALRALLAGESPHEVLPAAAPSRPRGEPPPVWLATAPTPRGLATAARLGDGWLASGFKAPPATVAAARTALAAARRDAGGHGPPQCGVVSLFLHVTERAEEARRVAEQLLGRLGTHGPAAPALALIGPAAQVAEELAAYAEAGADRLWLWPLGDAARQLERVAALAPSAAAPSAPA